MPTEWLISLLWIQRKKPHEIIDMKMNVLRVSRFSALHSCPDIVSLLLLRRLLISNFTRKLLSLSFQKRCKCIDHNTRGILSKYSYPHSLWITR